MEIVVNGVTLFYETAGNGSRSILLLHGNGESGRIFDRLIPELSADFTVYAMDSRNQGRSGKSPKLSYQMMVDDTVAFIQKLKIEKPIDAIEHGLVYLTEDRKALGLFLELSIKMNIEAMRIQNVAKHGLVYNALEVKHAEHYVDMLGIRCGNVSLPVSSLSGGNQQKVILSVNFHKVNRQFV